MVVEIDGAVLPFSELVELVFSVFSEVEAGVLELSGQECFYGVQNCFFVVAFFSIIKH